MDTSTLPILTLFLWGIIWFCVSILVMVLLFGIAGQHFLKDGKKLAVWLILSVAMPASLQFATTALNTKISASSEIRLTSSEAVRSGDHVVVNLITSEPAILYLLVWNQQNSLWVPLLPTTDVDLKKDHSFFLSPESAAGKLRVSINGQVSPLNLSIMTP